MTQVLLNLGMVRIYNTLTKQEEDLGPARKLNMFVCGPTVYDYFHIGNARTFVFFDVLAKYLRHRGYDVNYVQNITDIEDKIIKRSQEQGIPANEFARKWFEQFVIDATNLGIDSVTQYEKASEHIDDIIAQIQLLIKKGYAYSAPAIKLTGPDAIQTIGNQDVYFAIHKFKEYGKLSGQALDKLEQGARVEAETNKANPQDFVIWKAQNYTYEPTWHSPWGAGRPGWHIEDTAITNAIFGPQYDLHGGGMDLMFPHHEAEIALAESAYEKVPFVKFWMHTGFLEVNKEKMAKSLGNFSTAHDMLEKYPAEALRLYFLSSHYRSPLDFNEQNIIQAEAGTQRIAEFLARLGQIKPKANGNAASAIQTAQANFIEAMDADINAPKALGVIFELIRSLNANLENLSDDDIHEIKSFFEFVQNILGIVPATLQSPPEDIQTLVDQREKARKEKDFTTSDKIRDELKTKGYAVDDTVHGQLVKQTHPTPSLINKRGHED